MRIAKAVNQYYGSYFEQAIASIINEVEVSNTTGFSFPKDHEAEIEADARSVSKEEILSKSDSSLGLKISGKNSISNGFVRATFSWQNGIGLNNPTIRVFI